MSRSQQMTEQEREKAIRQAGLKSHSYAYEYKGAQKAPSYERALQPMSDAELTEEIEGGRGGEGYQQAALAEARRRGLEI